jgi:hypothetical protein
MSRLDAFKGFIGDLHRPFAILATSSAAAFSTVWIAIRGEDFGGAAAFIGAVFAGVVGLYVGKSMENVGVAKHTSPPVEPKQ